MSKVVLGKGLGALIPSEAGKAAGEKRLRMVSLDGIAPNPMQPRRDFDEASLIELAESFKMNGIIQPIVVRQDGAVYTIIVGERRFRAARLAGLEEIPVMVMEDVDDAGMLELALVENLQRENLNPLEVAEAYRMLIEKCGLTQREVAEKVGRSRTAVTNLLRLLMLPDSVKSYIREGKLSEGHARAVLAVNDEAEMLRLSERIVNESLSVRQTEEVTRRSTRRRLVPKKKLPAIAEMESYLKRLLATSVKISHGLKRGRIKIEYYGDDDLNRLLELFRRIEQ
ncbi:MAG: ParB/RepB/Spo0J family partition protein [candidate division Zixibacteria bacterium]|nr:ParB/RepB/Spo0J family partition protein [candidate division Zixibacteria bacterium]